MKVLGPEHPDTLTIVHSLAALYRARGQYELAEPLYKRAVAGAKTKLGHNHPNTKNFINNLKQLYIAMGKYPEAGALIQEQLALTCKNLKSGSPELGGQLAVAGMDLLGIQQYADAEKILRESLEIREKTQPDVWNTFNAQALFGGALLGQKKYAEAEPLLLKGYEGMKAREQTIPPQGSIRIPEALDRLITLYTATNKPDEAKKYRELRANYPNERAPRPREKK